MIIIFLLNLQKIFFDAREDQNVVNIKFALY